MEKGHYKNLPPVSEYMSWLCFGQLRLPTLISCPDCKVLKKEQFFVAVLWLSCYLVVFRSIDGLKKVLTCTPPNC